MMKKRFTALILAAVLIFAVCLPAASAAPTDSFTHWDFVGGTKKAVYSRDVYKAQAVISARSLGLDHAITVEDIAPDSNGQLYILCENGEILVLDQNLDFIKYFKITNKDGEPVDFAGAKGISVSKDHVIYIGDTVNGRVLAADMEGNVIQEITTPESPVLPEDFTFVPTKTVRDSKGYLYVISDGAYYGALLFDEDYRFVSFYGANAVKATVLSVLGNLWDMMTKNDEKRSQEMRKLPYQFLDIALDEEDFAYTCTGITADENDVGQIRMLSPGGTNILDKNFGVSVTDASSFNFAEYDVSVRRNKKVRQNFIGVDVDDKGFIYALDSTYGLIYVYDSDCNLITAFGGGRDAGDRIGSYSGACAIAVQGGRVFVADHQWNQITVYEQTEYGNQVLQAQALTLDGEYTAAMPLWNEIAVLDQNNRLALSALAKAAYAEGNYQEAMSYAKQAIDRVTYDQAMKKVHENFLSAHFIGIFFVCVAVAAGLVALLAVSRKKELVLVKNKKLRTMFSCTLHPFSSFYDIKLKKQGSVWIAAVLTALFFITSVISTVYTDFRFTSFDAVTYNPIYPFLTTVGLIFLWSGANWAVSVLQQGKGRYQEVFIVTAYAVLPMIVYYLAATGLSYVITSSSDVLLKGLRILALILTGIILTVGTMVIHEFSFPRFLLTAILTVLAMILIVFVIFMIGMLLSQLWQFMITVIMEVSYR